MTRILPALVLALLTGAAPAQVTPVIPRTDASGADRRPQATVPARPRVRTVQPPELEPRLNGGSGVNALGHAQIAAEIARLEALNRLRDSMEALRESIGLSPETDLGSEIDRFILARCDPVEQALSVRMTHEILDQLPKVTIQPMVLSGPLARGFVGDGTGFV